MPSRRPPGGWSPGIGLPGGCTSSRLDHGLKVELPNPPNSLKFIFLAVLAANEYEETLQKMCFFLLPFYMDPRCLPDRPSVHPPGRRAAAGRQKSQKLKGNPTWGPFSIGIPKERSSAMLVADKELNILRLCASGQHDSSLQEQSKLRLKRSQSPLKQS